MSTVLEQIEPVTLKHGTTIELVRWHLTADGWTYELVRGTYRRRNRKNITVDVDGHRREFSRRVWHVCAV